MLKQVFVASAVFSTTFLAACAMAESPLDAALNAGQRLTAEQIAAKIVDHTITARSGERTFIFHYGADNVLTGRMVDGPWSDTGYYGITDDDRVCLSMSSDDGRLRCMTLVAQGDVVQKFNLAGDMTFELLSFEPGNKL